MPGSRLSRPSGSSRKPACAWGATILGLGAVAGLIQKRKLIGALLAAGGTAGVAASIGLLK